MIIPYLRSSSYGSHSGCPHNYFIEYVIGTKFPSNQKADMGNIFHKVMELLANKKLAIQAGEKGYTDELFGWLPNDVNTWQNALELSYDYYVSITPHHTWTKKHKKTCEGWIEKTLAMNNGVYNPENMNIVAAEKTFDITINKEWAKFDYLEGDFELTGQLSIKGTVDLVIDEGDGILSVLDWKTGRREDFHTGILKDYKKLRYDPQLCIYYYALNQVYPDAVEIFPTINFVNTGGPFTLPYCKEDLPYCEDIIRKKFETIKATKKPRLVKSWKCTKTCGSGKTQYGDTGLTYCEFFARQVAEKGADKVFVEFGDRKKISTYQDGGGRKADE